MVREGEGGEDIIRPKEMTMIDRGVLVRLVPSPTAFDNAWLPAITCPGLLLGCFQRGTWRATLTSLSWRERQGTWCWASRKIDMGQPSSLSFLAARPTRLQ